MQSLSILAVPKPWRLAPLRIHKGTEGLKDKLLLCLEKERKAKCSTTCALGLVHWGWYKPTVVHFARRTIMSNDKVINLLHSD